MQTALPRTSCPLILPARIALGAFSLLWPLTASGQTDAAIEIESLTTALIFDATVPAQEAGTLNGLVTSPGKSVRVGDDIGTLDSERQTLAVQVAQLALGIAELKAADQLPLEASQAHVREAEQLHKQLEIEAAISKLRAESDVAVRLAEKSREVAQFELDRAGKAREAFAGAVSNAELNRLQVLFDQKTLEIEKAGEDRTIARMQPDADAASVTGQLETVARAKLLAAQELHAMELARANLGVAETDLKLAQLQLARRKLVVPFDGIIVEVLRQPGEWVEAGTPIYRIVQLDRLRVEGFVDADVGSRLRSGLLVQIQLHGDAKGDPIAGQISFVSPEIDPVNHQVRLQAEFENPDHRIRPGLVASMSVIVRR